MQYLAHKNQDTGEEQPLLLHLENTARLAERFSAAFDTWKNAYCCGFLHDIGKFPEKFQRRIRGSGEYVDHSTAGTQVALKEGRNISAAFCIAGHHGGIPDMGTSADDPMGDGTLWAKIKREPGKDIEDYSAYKSEISVPQTQSPCFGGDAAWHMFYIRFLYSCLVDADFLDTEAFMSGGSITRTEGAPLSALLDRLYGTIQKKHWLEGKAGLNKQRSDILRALLKAGLNAKGLFSLTVPTGGGKTISSMAFALRHAIENNMRRIIYVIPYTSIIEQTQQVFEEIFGAENVLAHFFNVDYGDNEQDLQDKRRLAAENWDAPIILTTAVQFFESLYANRSSRCRKLHNIAESVIIFDEAQMIPLPYLRPCVHAVAQLVSHYGCSAVLCTATQPSLDRLFREELPDKNIEELCPEPEKQYTSFRRVRYEYAGTLENTELAENLNRENQVLCIVNSKKQAQDIFAQMEGGRLFSSVYNDATRRPARRA